MNITALRVVLDTNILIAVIDKRSPFRWIFDCIVQGRIILCVSNDILFEYREILAKKTSHEVAENVVNFITINPYTEKTDIFFNFGLISEDADDNKFVDCAIASNAVCLVSNDKHFQVLKTIDFPKVTVFELHEFEEKYKTNSENSDFRELVRLLDQDLQIRDGDDHSFYAQFNKVDKIRYVVVAYEDGEAVGCGAIKEYAGGAAEIKRMFVRAERRGRGIAKSILSELETWASELGFSECILETGWNQPEAIGLYQKCGYETIPNYGQYSGVENSVCMKKLLRKE